MKHRQDPRWPNAHTGLKRLYEERVQEGVSQAEFGAAYGLGVQGMVWQYLNGYTPLNYDAAAKFAKGLHCTIRDFSPEMADALEAEIIPFLGRRLRRTALLLLVLVPMLSPSEPQAEPVYYVKSLRGFSVLHNVLNTHCMRTLRRLRAWLKRVLTPCYLFVFL